MHTDHIIIYEYCMIRYVPDIERGEFANIGLLMMCKRMRWIKSEIKIDADRLNTFFARADVDLLLKQSKIYEGCDAPRGDLPVEERYRWMAAVKSAIIQTSPSHPGIIEHGEGEDRIELLEKTFRRLSQKLL